MFWVSLLLDTHFLSGTSGDAFTSVSFSTIIFFSPSAFLVFSILSYISSGSAPYIFSPYLAATVAVKSASAAAGMTG